MSTMPLPQSLCRRFRSFPVESPNDAIASFRDEAFVLLPVTVSVQTALCPTPDRFGLDWIAAPLRW